MRNWLMCLRIVILSLCLLPMTIVNAQESTQEVKPGITIDKDGIVKNRFIKGRVSGIDASHYDQYKIVVYVLTDKWYIHPYATGGEGKSFAKIAQDGTWKILTVRREFGAYEVAALIVKKDYKPPVTVENIERIEYVGIPHVKDTGYKDGDKDWDL